MHVNLHNNRIQKKKKIEKSIYRQHKKTNFPLSDVVTVTHQVVGVTLCLLIYYSGTLLNVVTMYKNKNIIEILLYLGI